MRRNVLEERWKENSAINVGAARIDLLTPLMQVRHKYIHVFDLSFSRRSLISIRRWDRWYSHRPE